MYYWVDEYRYDDDKGLLNIFVFDGSDALAELGQIMGIQDVADLLSAILSKGYVDCLIDKLEEGQNVTVPLINGLTIAKGR